MQPTSKNVQVKITLNSLYPYKKSKVLALDMLMIIYNICLC